MDPDDQNYRQNAPENRGCQGNVPLEIPGSHGVVPEPDVEPLLQHSPRHIFQYRGADHSHKKDLKRMMPHGIGHEQDQNRAESVDGDKGPVEESPVHPLLRQDGNISGLPCPPCKRIKEEI